MCYGCDGCHGGGTDTYVPLDAGGTGWRRRRRRRRRRAVYAITYITMDVTV